MKAKKLNTWTIKRHNYTIASKTYDKPKTENELRNYAVNFIVDHDIYEYKLRIEYSYEGDNK